MFTYPGLYNIQIFWKPNDLLSFVSNYTVPLNQEFVQIFEAHSPSHPYGVFALEPRTRDYYKKAYHASYSFLNEPYIGFDNHSSVVSTICRRIRRQHTEVLGTICMDLNHSGLNKTFQNTQFGSHGYLYMFDPQTLNVVAHSKYSIDQITTIHDFEFKPITDMAEYKKFKGYITEMTQKSKTGQDHESSIFNYTKNGNK